VKYNINLAAQLGGKVSRTSNDHIEYILSNVSDRLPEKYLKGVAEHKGNLWRKRVDAFQTDEVIDFIVYHFTNLEQKEEAIAKLGSALGARDWGLVKESLNILTIGNPEGIPEEEA